MSISAAGSTGYSDPNQFVPVFASENAVTAREDAAQRANKGDKELTMFAEEEPSFWDLLDVINPLQHIPVVNTIYQELTGDKIGVGARLAGGTLFGGAIGLIASAVNVLIEGETGDDIGGHVMAMFKGDDSADSTALAQNQATPAQENQQIAAAFPLSQNPAQEQQIALSGDGPVIDVPQTQTAQGGAMPMMFSADGIVPVTDGEQTPVAVAAPVEQSMQIKPQATNVQQLAALNHPARFMPVPARTTMTAEKSPPPVLVPIANGSAKSNVPVTGRGPVGNLTPDPLAVQRAMAQQGINPADHPMLTGANSTAMAGMTQNAGPGGGVDWVQSMNTALDRYQKAGNLAARPAQSSAMGLQ